MNYIDQIRGFWNRNNKGDIQPVDGFLYFAILEFSNSMNWRNPFIFQLEIFTSITGLSRNTIYRSLERLNKAGIIKYKPGKRGNAGTITIPKFGTSMGIVREQYGNNMGTVWELNINYKPKTINEVIDYFKSNGYREDVAERAYGYYEELGWHDRNGKPIKNWKNQMRNNWFKPEYKLSWKDVPWRDTMKMKDKEFVEFMKQVPDQEWFSDQRVRYAKIHGV